MNPEWRLRLRELDAWAVGEMRRDLAALHADYQSAEIEFEAWPQPWPLTVRRHVVRQLVAIHDAWYGQLSAFDSPCYLGIWLFEPLLVESQVVAATGSRAIDYQMQHASGVSGSPPPDYEDLPCALTRFEWSRHAWEYREPLSEFADDVREQVLHEADRIEGEGENAIAVFERLNWRARLRCATQVPLE